MRATYHIHCDFCDGKASARDMAEAARASGLEALGFSSHAPLGQDEFEGNMRRERLGAYLAEIRGLAREWEGRGLEILAGLEVDWLRGVSAPGESPYPALGLDFAIGSVHLVDLGGGPFAVDSGAEELDARVASDSGGDARRVWKAYYEELSALIAAGGFDILGHFDLVRKNNRGGRLFDEGEIAYRRAALDAVALLAESGAVAEVNYGGPARGRTESVFPAPFILRALRERGVRVTLSADAHAPANFAPRWRELGREAAREAGYTAVAVLAGGEWTEVGLDEA